MSEGTAAAKVSGAVDATRLPATAFAKEGWPDLPASQAPNSKNAEAVTLPQGKTIYRIIDDPAKAAGGYWSEKMPHNIGAWRSAYAVKPEWNDDGFYVEHTVESESGLNVWQGPASSQGDFPGGASQIWMKREASPPDRLCQQAGRRDRHDGDRSACHRTTQFDSNPND